MKRLLLVFLLCLPSLALGRNLSLPSPPPMSGAFVADACFPDDTALAVGGTCTAPDYWFEYTASGTYAALHSTNCDGGGADCVLAWWDDGTGYTYLGTVAQGVRFDTGTNGQLALTDEAGGALTLVLNDNSSKVTLGSTGATSIDKSLLTFGVTNSTISTTDRSGGAATFMLSLATGAQTNAGDVASGALSLSTGATTTDGATGDITLTTGAAGAGAADAGDIIFKVNGTSTVGTFIGSTGAMSLNGGNAKGALTTILTNTETLTFAADPGDVSKTTSSLIPDGAFLIGVTTRVTTAATNCTSVNIGDGADGDLFGAATGITQNTTTTNADATAAFSNPLTATVNVTITGVGGNCFDGVWAVTAHYLLPSAATSN